MKKCRKCNVEMKVFQYTCDYDYEIRSPFIFDEQDKEIGKLIYCPNCGIVKLNLKEDNHDK